MFLKLNKDVSSDFGSTAKRCLRRNRDWRMGGKGGDSMHSSLDRRMGGRRGDSGMKIGSLDESRSQSNGRAINSINMGSVGMSIPYSEFSDSDARTSSKLSSAALSQPVYDSQNNLQAPTLGHTFRPAMEGRVSQLLGGSGIGLGLGMQGRERRHRDSESFAESTGHLISGVSTVRSAVLCSVLLFLLCSTQIFSTIYLPRSTVLHHLTSLHPLHTVIHLTLPPVCLSVCMSMCELPPPSIILFHILILFSRPYCSS
jgi:hypothetical protein